MATDFLILLGVHSKAALLGVYNKSITKSPLGKRTHANLSNLFRTLSGTAVQGQTAMCALIRIRFWLLDLLLFGSVQGLPPRAETYNHVGLAVSLLWTSLLHYSLLV
jgi:hypothetical protein